MKILNALDLKKGKKAEQNRMYNVSQPLQFLPRKDKDEDWAAWNMDWLEWEGLKQIRKNARRLMKNYKLANGLIDRTDYVVEDNNEMRDLVQTLASDEPNALELKFYPIIPNVVNVLVAEFAKRNSKVNFRAVDEYTYNEILNKKGEEIEHVLVKQAEAKLLNSLIEQGADINDPEIQQMLQEQLSPEKLKTLPEIEDFYNKDYEVIAEKWASKQHVIDEQRFRMDELEERAFRDMLITDREFWHFRMMEDDYDIEVWNPVLTFYHKSPNKRYISQSNFVGKIEKMTSADVIDTLGWLMTEEQMVSLQYHYPIKSAGYPLTGYQSETKYDATRSHSWNTDMPSLAYRQLRSMTDNSHNSSDIVDWVLNESEDQYELGAATMLRVTQAYWKSQRRVGHLTKVSESGEVTTQIIDEAYKITDKPVYNTQLIQNKTEANLLFGEHIEWIWFSEVYGGIKIGPNHPSFYGENNSNGISPIYLGVNQNQIKPLKFQFKGDNSIYGSKLPVEGRVFSDRNSISASLVDAMKPFQIGYNMVNNQIADILIDELGTVVMLDQNTLPKHSLGEDWGKGNLAKAYVAMKDFSMLPLDTSIANTENALNFQHFQQLDLSQTNRLMSRIQLAGYFKQEAFQVVGVSPQRMGQQLGQHQTATGIEQAVSGSYAQTEMYFVNHSDHLMPRVHEMRTNLAQYYFSTNPSIRMQHTTSNDERANFEINGTDLLLRDLNVYCSAKANHRHILEQMKQLAMSNNTAGASIYDLGRIIESDSLGSLNSVLKGMETKQQAQAQEQRAHEQQMAQQAAQSAEKEKAMELNHETQENEKKNRKDILVAEIKSAGFGAMQDINENKQSDYMDALDKIQKTEQYEQTVNLQQQKVSNTQSNDAQKTNLKKEEMSLKRELKNKDVQIARENKNQYDTPSKDKKKK